MAKKPYNSGKKLELRVANAYRKLGARKVEHNVDLGGNQIDVYVELEQHGSHVHRLAIEAKDWTSTDGKGVVNDFAQIVNLLRGERLIHEAVIVSDSGFTHPARGAAKTHGITLREIEDLEEKAKNAGAGVSTTPASSNDATPLAPACAHPYPMPKHWTGRVKEMDELDGWLKDGQTPMRCMEAIGGAGKSSLSWAWLEGRVIPKQEEFSLHGVFQWSFYEGEVSFQTFIKELSDYLDASKERDLLTGIIDELRTKRCLLVLDGFERLLFAYGSAEAALTAERTKEELGARERRCSEWPTVRLLRALLAGTAAKTLLNGRLVPEELDDLAGWEPMPLKGLDPGDAAKYLRANSINGTDKELRDAAKVYGFHPLSLSKLVNVLHYDTEKPDDIAQAAKYDVGANLKANQRHILARAYETLPAEIAQFLSSLAALRGKATMTVARFLAGDASDAVLPKYLRRLEDERWITWDRKQNTLDFHPVVRRYAYDKLADKPATHNRLVEYFRPIADKIGTKKVETIRELAPVIELYTHLARAGRYDDAYQVLTTRLRDMLYYRLGAYQTCIELLRMLFPDGEDRPPRSDSERARAWMLNSLANSYSVVGQCESASSLFEVSEEIIIRQGSQEDLALALAGRALNEIKVGQLASAEANVRRAIELSCEAASEYHEAGRHLYLGWTLTCRGAFDEADEELARAVTGYSQLEHTQGEGVSRAYRAQLALYEGDADRALTGASKARELAEVERVERDIIQSEWLVGAALVALAEKEEDAKRDELLSDAEAHLADALTRCRRINLAEFEPDIMLSWARWHRLSGDAEQARECADEALAIADRCEYRLKQADIHNFLAQLALDAKDKKTAREHAEIGKERAFCDGPPHCYKPALVEAERLLKAL